MVLIIYFSKLQIIIYVFKWKLINNLQYFNYSIPPFLYVNFT